MNKFFMSLIFVVFCLIKPQNLDQKLDLLRIYLIDFQKILSKSPSVDFQELFEVIDRWKENTSEIFNALESFKKNKNVNALLLTFNDSDHSLTIDVAGLIGEVGLLYNEKKISSKDRELFLRKLESLLSFVQLMQKSLSSLSIGNLANASIASLSQNLGALEVEYKKIIDLPFSKDQKFSVLFDQMKKILSMDFDNYISMAEALVPYLKNNDLQATNRLYTNLKKYLLSFSQKLFDIENKFASLSLDVSFCQLDTLYNSYSKLMVDYFTLSNFLYSFYQLLIFLPKKERLEKFDVFNQFEDKLKIFLRLNNLFRQFLEKIETRKPLILSKQVTTMLKNKVDNDRDSVQEQLKEMSMLKNVLHGVG